MTKMAEDQPLDSKMLSRQIEGAQKKVEEMNFVSRKNVLKYDDVMNKQRTVIYEQRRRVLEGADLHDEVVEWIDEVVENVVAPTRSRGRRGSTSRGSSARCRRSTRRTSPPTSCAPRSS